MVYICLALNFHENSVFSSTLFACGATVTMKCSVMGMINNPFFALFLAIDILFFVFSS